MKSPLNENLGSTPGKQENIKNAEHVLDHVLSINGVRNTPPLIPPFIWIPWPGEVGPEWTKIKIFLWAGPGRAGSGPDPGLRSRKGGGDF